MNWEGVSEFVAVVEAGSFTAAGKRLGVSTAQVSRQVNALEARLAIKLLYRTTRKVTVTEEGQLYFQHCRQALDGLEEAERALGNLKAEPSGLLRMTAPATYGERVIAPLVNDFLLRYPQLKVELELTNQKVDLIQGGFDLAIRLGQLQDSSMIARRLAARSQYLCAAPAYIEARGEPHTLAELEQHNCLRGTLEFWRFQDEGQSHRVRVRGSLHCNSGLALVDAALKGIGLVQLPDYYVTPYLASGALVALLERNRASDEGIWALYPQNRHLSVKVRTMIAHLRTALSETCG